MNFNQLPQGISKDVANKIIEVVSVFENGHKAGNYDAYVAYKDKKINDNYFRQITYGRFQTTEFGNLKKLIQMYMDANGALENNFIPYVDKIGKIENGIPQSFYEDNDFVNDLKLAGRTDPIMQEVQEIFFEKIYFQPALAWFKVHQFTQALSLLVIFDSYIHSGQIFDFLRNQFPAYPPNVGGNEQEWITQYVATRHAWLANYKTQETRASKYRTQTLKNLIASNNWDLSQAFQTQGVNF
jgi:chitosanase